MPKTEFWSEDFIFMRDPVHSPASQLALYCYLDSCWLSGARVGAGGGEYAIHHLVLEGCCEAMIGAERITCPPGSFLVLPRAYDAAYVTGDTPLRRKVLMVHRNSVFKLLMREMFGAEELNFELIHPGRVEAWFDAIRTEMRGEQSAPKLAGLYVSLLHELRSQRAADPRPELLRRILDYLENRFADPGLTRESVAENFTISVRTLCRLFEQYLATTPAAYLAALRLEQARRMLAIPTLSVKTIARQTGFSSSNYLCRLFRRRYGVSPEKFRRK